MITTTESALRNRGIFFEKFHLLRGDKSALGRAYGALDLKMKSQPTNNFKKKKKEKKEKCNCVKR